MFAALVETGERLKCETSLRAVVLSGNQHGDQLGAPVPGDGGVASGQIGGHRPRAIQGEHEVWLTARLKERAFTLRGLVAELARVG
ncbi:hypothetical protein D3874_04505 [Oleomonas cavernae]|uniref:Uncharacterized protein n=1 Tax=Oleomonas cavernae TaxID=2320859 RepID=A0A418W8Q4_9PROT|nr:hypothetical protein D3874_04505 [Oleomonas cavernae]